MDPNGNTDRNSLKRTRMGSLDAEHDRPPLTQRRVYPYQEPGSSHSVVVPSSGPGGQLHSNAVQPCGNLWGRDGSSPPPSGAWPLQVPLTNQSNLAPPIPSGAPLAMNHPIYSSPPNTSTPTHEWLMRTMAYNQSGPTVLLPPQTPASDFSTQTYISGGNNIENHGNFNFYQQTPSATPDPYLSQLHNYASANAIHTSAAVDDQGICIPGTRTSTVQRLQSLVTSVDSNHPDIIWMHGPAGAGKSAIMRTMANALSEQGVLLGSFFFFRTDAQRNTSAPFIPTLSLQSFTSFQATQHHIRNAIQSHPTIFSQSVRHQLRHLFETPLKLAAADEPRWTVQSPLVLVIDGLDECADADRQVEIIKAMRQLASTIRSSTNRRVKILISSRPQQSIQDEIESDKNSVTIIQVDPSNANVALYDPPFDEIRHAKNLPKSWRPLRQIKWLMCSLFGRAGPGSITYDLVPSEDGDNEFKFCEACQA